MGHSRREQQHQGQLNPSFILHSRQQDGFYEFLAVTRAVMTMTKDFAIWALSIPRIFQAFSLSHGMLHDYCGFADNVS